MKVTYPVIFTRTGDKKDTYLIYIPDLDGNTEGYGIADAVKMAEDYIGCRLYDMDNQDFPKASKLKEIDVSKGVFAKEGESFASTVEADIGAYRKMMSKKAVRRNVSIPGWLNDEADRAKINVSKVLQEALKQELGIA